MIIWKNLVTAVDALVKRQPELRQGIPWLILVGFGFSDGADNRILKGTVDFKSGLRTLNLSSWQKDNLDWLRHSLQWLPRAF